MLDKFEGTLGRTVQGLLLTATSLFRQDLWNERITKYKPHRNKHMDIATT